MAHRKIFFVFFLFLVSNLIAQKPNIIYILADDLGYAELGAYGQKIIKTPNLDKLANNGVKFTQFYTSSPVCAPSRCMFLTGKHSGEAYIRDNKEMGGYTDAEERGQFPLKSGTFTLAHLLKKEGYSTACIGKWGLGGSGSEGEPRNHGFDFFYGYLDQKQAHNLFPTHLWKNEKWDTLDNPVIYPHPKLTAEDKLNINFYQKFNGKTYAPDKIMAEAISYLDAKKNEPFFLYFTPTAPHLSLQIPDAYIDKFGYKFNETPYFAEKGYTPHNRPLAAYASSISLLDEYVGQLISTLEKNNQLKNTIIFFTSDNGTTFDVGGVNGNFFNSVAGLRSWKGSVYEGGIRVPFIVSNLGKPGTVVDQPAVSYDILPSIIELLNINSTEKFSGESLLPYISGKTKKRELYWEFSGYGGQKAFRSSDWKLVLTDLKKNKNALPQLYNLKNDREEKVDLSLENPKRLKKMLEKMKSYHVDSEIQSFNF